MNIRPLDSLKVLDFSTLLPGPCATGLLADMGATVLRVEAPTRHDLVKSLPPLLDQSSAAHHRLNRNKRSIALDLKQPEAVAIVNRLVQEYDILVEQFRPGVMDRLGLGYADLKKLNPRLIYCSITGYGQNGPYRERGGHDLNYMAISGVAAQCDQEGAPGLSAMQWGDLSGGLHAALGILAAEVQRRESGIGQHVDISMTDTLFGLNLLAGAGPLATGRETKPGQDWSDGGSFYGYYRTRDDKYLSIAGLEPVFVERLARLLEEPDLLGLSDLHERESQQRLKTVLARHIATRDSAEWLTVFADQDCCVEPVLTTLEAMQHPQIQARHMLIPYEMETGRPVMQTACPIQFSASKQRPSNPAPETGDQSLETLKELGYGEQEINHLLNIKAVASSAGM